MYRSRARHLFVLSLLILVAMVFPANLAFAQEAGDERLLSLDDPLAPFLESRAYAASLGATAEFRKMEWVALDEANNRVYWAMSEISKGMSDGEGDVNVEENMCGIVYAADLDAEYNVTKIYPYIVGGPYDENAEEDTDACDPDNIANPDGLWVDPAGNLWIAEDSGNHVNNVLWMYDGAELRRFATVPVGAEVTGLFVNSDGTVFFNAQHPSAMNLHPFNRGLIGVVNGFKAGDEFAAMPTPTGADMHRIMVAAGEYQILGRVGADIPLDIYAERFGQITRPDGSMQLICNHPDANMFLPIDEAATEGYLYTNFECTPGGVSKLYIRNTGASWEVLEGENVNFADVMGTWINCGGGVTPWNTALSAEEYEPLTTLVDWVEEIEPMTDYLGEQGNPYDYGYLVELIPDEDGDTAGTIVEKRYAMGRFSHENAVVMPDEKTVYHGDDGTDVVFFKFVADEAGDLSAGTLYAAKATQNDDGSFGIEWIELGAGSDDEIAEALLLMEIPAAE